MEESTHQCHEKAEYEGHMASAFIKGMSGALVCAVSGYSAVFATGNPFAAIPGCMTGVVVSEEGREKLGQLAYSHDYAVAMKECTAKQKQSPRR